MKILCVSDHKDPVVYSSQIKQRFKDIDLVLGAGDLDMEYYGFIVSSLNKPLLFVFGNHNLDKISSFKRKYREEFSDSLEYFTHSYGSICVGGKVTSINGIIVAGLGGTRKYNGGRNQFSEMQMFVRIAKLVPRLMWNKLFRGRYLDILLTHASPRGIGDQDDLCHRGFEVFLSFIKWFRPAFLIHGHVHLYDMNAQRRFQYLDTIVVNAYNHTIVEIEQPDAR